MGKLYLGSTAVCPIIKEPINNEDITVLTNGTYNCSQGYTGLGEVVVNVPSGGPQKNYCNINATVTDGIANNFGTHTDTSSNAYGGIQPLSCLFLNPMFPSGSTIFQVKIKTPSTAIQTSWDVPVGTIYYSKYWGTSGGSSDLIIQISSSLTTFKSFGLGKSSIQPSYNFSLNTWYIFQYRSNGIYISTDNGETYTRVDSNSYTVSWNSMKNVQFGMSANYNATTYSVSNCSIDLTKTGWINTSTGYSYMLIES